MFRSSHSANLLSGDTNLLHVTFEVTKHLDRSKYELMRHLPRFCSHHHFFRADWVGTYKKVTQKVSTCISSGYPQHNNQRIFVFFNWGSICHRWLLSPQISQKPSCLTIILEGSLDYRFQQECLTIEMKTVPLQISKVADHGRY